jgi:GTP cyclohydrolase I
MVYTEAEHLCMTMRGIKKPGSRTVSFVSEGVFKTDKELRDRFFCFIQE